MKQFNPVKKLLKVIPRSNTIQKQMINFTDLPCDIKYLIFHQNRVEKVKRKYKECYDECVVDEIINQFRPRRFGPVNKQTCFTVLERGRRLRKNGIAQASYPIKECWKLSQFNTKSKKFICYSAYPSDSDYDTTSSEDED